MGDLPIERLDFGFAVQVQQAEFEHRLRLFFHLLGVVQVLHAVLFGECALDLDDVLEEFRVAGLKAQRQVGGALLD